MSEPPIPRCHLFVTADCYGECATCPFGVLQNRPAPEPEPEPLPLGGFARLIETVKRIGYAVLLVLILGVLVVHVVTR
jgi:hypothetical protein